MKKLEHLAEYTGKQLNRRGFKRNHTYWCNMPEHPYFESKDRIILTKQTDKGFLIINQYQK